MPATVERLPRWVVNPAGKLDRGDDTRRLLRRGGLVTVCEEARCPNIGECFAERTATFMLLGDTCTRRCSFCSVATGRPVAVDFGEPARVAEAAAAMGLRYVVVTSVARDDLADEGAGQFASTIRALRARVAGIAVEVLTSDFNARPELVGAVIEALPDVFGHNVETVRRLTPEIRGRARYERSLEVLSMAAAKCAEVGQGIVKTGIMVGMGETRKELDETMNDIFDAGCRLLTIGQYLRPSRAHRPVEAYIEPCEFDELAAAARAIGFSDVASGPLVRSSYRADALFRSRPEMGS